MKKIAAAVAVIAYCIAAGGEISLAEKIALAKKMADAAAAGKEESGLVVNGGFDFSKMLEKYGNDIAQSDKTALPAPSEPEEPTAPDLPQPIPAPATAFEKVGKTSKKSDDAGSKKVLESQQGQDGAKIAEETGTQTARSTTKDVKKSTDAQHGGNRVVLPDEVPVNPVKPKYVVDTSKLKNGYYVKDADSALPQPEENSAPILSWSNSAFYLITGDGDSISLARKILEGASSMFYEFETGEGGDIKLGDKIIVQIVTDAEKYKNAAQYSMDKNGGVTLTVLWNEKLDFAHFCRLVSGALFRKAIYERSGKVVRECPMWLDEALSVYLQCRVKLGLTGEFADISAENPPRPLKEILGKTAILSENDSAECFWTLKTLERLSSRDGKFWPLLMKLSAMDAQKSYAEIEKLSPQNFEIVWNCFISGEIWSRVGGVYNTRASRNEIVRLSFLQAEDTSGEPLGLNPADAWKYRENTLVRYNIERRLMEIKVALPRINPLYAEALVNLGRVFEAALDDDKDEFDDASKAFAEKFAEADKISDTARKMLSGN